MENKVWVILNTIVLCLSIIWFIVDGGFEPIIVGVLSIITLIYQGIDQRTEGISKIKMKQSSGKNSKNYQAKGDINITNEK